MRNWQLWLVAVLLVVAGFFAAVKKVHQDLPVYTQVPAFEFQDQNGKPFSSVMLSNRVWVAGFIFTRCMGPCPLISAKMAELKKRLHYSDRFSLVSFTVDPDYDTPEKLKEYSVKFEREGRPSWYFLTGAKEKIYEIAVKTFMQTASQDPSQKDIQARFMHGTRLSLVDDKGRVRGFYSISDADAAERLERDIRAIL